LCTKSTFEKRKVFDTNYDSKVIDNYLKSEYGTTLQKLGIKCVEIVLVKNNWCYNTTINLMLKIILK
jgi:hypothetical protein